MAAAASPRAAVPKYRSTRGGISGLSFEDAVFEGLARDGGLLVPDWVPDVSGVYKNWASLRFDELAYEIASRFCGEADVSAADMRELMRCSYASFEHPEVVPCVKVGDIHVMELFHGPSFSFKDVALQALGNFYEFFLKRRSRRLTILCATSGDTGSAAITGLQGKANVDCFVLFPEGRVSPIQQNQMTSVLDPNVHCIAVQGTFDDCQNIVKATFCELDFKRKFGLGAVNSINWARILFQITYYFYTYYKLYPQCDGSATFAVPTGNFGDILAGYYAKRMGLPVRDLVVATNSNDILHRFFTKGEYDRGSVYQTTSPSMDIQISSNFERYLFYLFGEDTAKLSEAMVGFTKTGQLHAPQEMVQRAAADFKSARASEEQVDDTMRSYLERHRYVACPHTACALSAIEQLRAEGKCQPAPGHEVVVLGTAHPGKFRDTVARATGTPPTLPAGLARAQEAKTRFQTLPNSACEVQTTIERSLYYRGTYLMSNERTPQPTDRCEALPSEPGMWLVALDVEGTLTPEAWLELQKKTGLEELKITTAHEPDYDKLMMHRIDALRRHGIKLQDMKDVVDSIEPLAGCKEFLTWLQTLVPRVLLLTDTFEEYAMPMFEKLGFPSVFCNSLTVNEDGFITGHILRLRDQKRKAVESFQRLNFRVISIGDSFNDISMMKAAERGILMYPSERVVAAHPEFPVCRSYDELKARICEIVMDPPAVPARELAVPVPLEYEAAYRSMHLVLANVAGTFAPEPWPALYAMTGIPELKTTTASHRGSYAELMQLRSKAMRENGVKLQQFFDVLKSMEPLPGAREFLAWLKPLVPRSFMLTDTFEEYALPIFAKLGHPMVFSNFLEADKEGYMTQHVVRLEGQKKLAVEEFQRLNFRIIAIGCSFNDIEMLKAAEHGILFSPSEQLVTAHPEFPVARNYEELKAKFLEILNGASKKRKNPFD